MDAKHFSHLIVYDRNKSIPVKFVRRDGRLKALFSKAFFKCTKELTGEWFGNGRYYSLSAVPLVQNPQGLSRVERRWGPR